MTVSNHYIYTITDPFNNKVIYVGRTGEPAIRFKSHMCKNPTRISAAIQELKKKGLMPIFTIIENCGYLAAGVREKYWIKHYSSLGNELLNVERRKKGILYEVKVLDGVELDEETKKSFE